MSIISCHECGIASDVERLKAGEVARCPRCHSHLLSSDRDPVQGPVCYALASLIAFAASLAYPFMSFSIQGITQQISLYQAAKVLANFGNDTLSVLLISSVLVLPAIYLICLLYLYFCISNRELKQFTTGLQIKTLKFLTRIKPWLLVDVFLIGVLVSLVKISALADVSMGISFWAFAIFTCLMVKTIATADLFWVWQQLFPYDDTDAEQISGHCVQDKNHLSCHVCGLIHQYTENEIRCNRCATRLHTFEPKQNLQVVWAFLLTSMVFYLPANLYPMMYTSALGSNSQGSTILGGVIELWEMGDYPVALIILFASILIPIAKMMSLSFLFWHAKRVQHMPFEASYRYLKLYRVTEFIGRWSMIDIFVVAILVALVQIDGIMVIYPGPAALYFAAVVIFTMLSAMTFDSRMMWR
ncbi:paraquat-inducible protein A [Vibrio inusitatus NBRC 102082]|uniref:Paraquat-inducible protein A n=1 Tax=Vibrio inusitatus NBRC 102082 TaxID=1219070 RepID=A0A4Y3HX13_9VIBR|nr:paraquat-inducible protein A [Vibrio inusitatus]GEA50804.1 paraquat-inducible protein A [Vibrio inusitatus NBRC 102082]